MSELTEMQIASLNWMRVVNDKYGIGLFWPTIKRGVAIPECDALVEQGLARRNTHGARNVEHCGYWIMPPGRSILATRKP